MLRITTLIENNADDKNKLVNEHGLSLYIEADGKKILFDTGQSGAFVQNAEKLGKDLSEIDCAIISHGHYDHSGGFRKLVGSVPSVPQLIVGKGFFEAKHKYCEDGETSFIGNSFNRQYVEDRQILIKEVEEDIFRITENVMLFHNFRRSNEFEKLNEKFFIDQGGSRLTDDFSDEISLGIVTDKGLVVVVGCSHVGVLNILETIKERTGLPIYAVLGGTHLVDADADRIAKTMAAFRKLGISRVAVSHCTGSEGIAAMRQEFKGNFIYNNTGNVFTI